jgi:superfamily II DNA/RNA helicase
LTACNCDEQDLATRFRQEQSMQFAEYKLIPSTHAALEAMGYTDPTPIQAQAIPLMLQGDDVIGRAQTGTGKTAAFGIPLVEGLHDTYDGIVGLVLVPTRELASQVHEVIRDLAKGTRLRTVKVFGGTGFGAQIANVQQHAPMIVVACPGRLLDLIERGVMELSHVEMLVLDEADRMLDMGFIHDMKKIFKLLPAKRQSSMFSATLDSRVMGIAKDILRDPKTVEIESETTAIELTEQFHTRVEKSEKWRHLQGILDQEQPGKAVIFTRTKHQAKRIADRLSKTGWNSVALQGNMSQAQRDRSMKDFRDGKARILVATDVAARGLDVPNITHIVNHDIPQEPEQYVHRIGRTGRNGATGKSFTFVQSDEVSKWKAIKKIAGTEVPHHEIGVEGEPVRGPDVYVAPVAPTRNTRPQTGATPHRGKKQNYAKQSGSSRGRGRSSGGGGGYGGGQRRN